MASTNQTEHALYMFTRTFDRYKHESFLNLGTYSDGIPFGYMINTIDYFNGIVDDLQVNAQKWTQKLANLKKILNKMQTFVQSQSNKILKINDLQLVQIAKNNSQQEILKYFQVVIAVLMQTPEKQDYIQRIMGLDQRSQQALVIVVQNAMQERISETNHNANNQSLQQLTSLQNENHILTQQINQLCKQNESLLKKNNDLQQKLHQYQQQIQKARNLNMEIYMNNNSKTTEIQRQNSLIETLKKKILQITRQHQLQLSKFNDQIYHLKSKINHYKDIQQELIQRNKLLQDKIKNYTFSVDDQRKRLQKSIDQKDAKLKKLQFQLEISKNKIRELSQDIQVNDLNLRMELQRKQVRFKQLQKQVKNRLIEPNLQINKKPSDQQLSPKKNEQNEQQLQYLKAQVQKLRNSSRQLQRQNLKLKKKSQKVQAIQNEKKKLQKIILDVSKCRDSQIEMLVVSLYDLRNQNIRMHEIIKQLKYRQESKYE